MVYNEPRDWILNPKQYLGSAYLLKKDYAKAEETLQNDLKVNNRNVWSLNRLYDVHRKRSEKAEAEAVQKDFKDASSQSDIDFKKLYF
jgi:uncharacterized protein HemY